ncbi:hypothetical protein [Sphingobium sp. ZW T5_29]|uniref:hypothetical protein n=1 Tax=Sphingobium sp. ZW T5_29 TaxID=3378077 RepID=UPI0038530F91
MAAINGDGRNTAPTIFPRTLAELREFGRDFGDAAVAEARWSAITIWLMKGEPSAGLSNPRRVTLAAVHMAQEHDRYHLGWPCWKGEEASRATPVLDGLSPDCQREAKLVAAETLADWERVGCPWMDAKQAYLRLTSTPAFINKYSGPQTGTDTSNKRENQ